MLAVLLTVLPARAAGWPDWQLPAPLKSAGGSDLVYPNWFAGTWQLINDPAGGATPAAPVRFDRRADGTVVGDRAFNARSLGQALLGSALLAVENDPSNPNRQLARLQGDQLLESTVIARRSEMAEQTFWADELALQVVHGPGAPRISRIETLSRYQRQSDGTIRGEQWQANYPSPSEGLASTPVRTGHWLISLTPDG
jgi:hypothetical protein